jgi:hypothetical protein
MKKQLTLHVTELIYILSFLIYLAGSSLALFEHGTELSLWLMTLPFVITFASTILPWIGIRGLQLDKAGCHGGIWLARILQAGSWGTFLYAMYLRLYRQLPPFYAMIALTTLLWAAWLLILLLSRRGCQPGQGDDTLIE